MKNEIINSMDVDELRNYAFHLQELDDARRQYIGAQRDMIDILQQLYNCQLYRDDSNMKLHSKLVVVQRLQEELTTKYSEKSVITESV